MPPREKSAYRLSEYLPKTIIYLLRYAKHMSFFSCVGQGKEYYNDE